MKWTRALYHLETLAQTCTEMSTRPSTIFPLRVAELWAFGAVLGGKGEIEAVTVALAVELPADEVPWLGEPAGAQHWASAARLNTNPIRALWRSVHAPVWNHHIDRPVLVWDATGGTSEEVLAALRDGQVDAVRPPAPTADELRARLGDELAVSLRALRDRTRDYQDRRWKPGKLEPLADGLWRAGDGYLDVLDAVSGLTGRE